VTEEPVVELIRDLIVAHAELLDFVSQLSADVAELQALAAASRAETQQTVAYSHRLVERATSLHTRASELCETSELRRAATDR